MFETTRRVEFCETDMAGIVHFAEFFRYMEQAEHEFYRARNTSVFGQLEDGTRFSFPRVAASCDYKSPAFYGDELAVSLSISRRGSKSLTYEIRFLREATLIAVGQLTVCAVAIASPGQMKAIPIPDVFLERIG